MSVIANEETVATPTTLTRFSSGTGCLLQIYPLDVIGNVVELTEPRTTVGRGSDCEVIIEDTSVSRCHAVIENTGTDFVVTDLESTNGTRVNGEKSKSTVLTPGDRVKFGKYIFKFLSTDDIETQFHEAMYSLMTRDGLTGVLNKRSFTEIFDREFERASRIQSSLSVILFDIDHFKGVNDTYGHLAGDEVLQAIAERISSTLIEQDALARYGGEEFAILLPDRDLTEAIDIAERCRIAVAERPFSTTAGDLRITISVGVANSTELESPEKRLMQVTDERLYKAKNGGRNQVCGI